MDYDCKICYVNNCETPVILVNCLHKFCLKCVEKWFFIKTVCPLCKDNTQYIIDNDVIIPINTLNINKNNELEKYSNIKIYFKNIENIITCYYTNYYYINDLNNYISDLKDEYNINMQEINSLLNNNYKQAINNLSLITEKLNHLIYYLENKDYNELEYILNINIPTEEEYLNDFEYD